MVRPLEILTQELDQRVPTLGLRVEALERLTSFGVRRIVAQDRLVLIDGFLSVRARLGEPRDLGGEGGLVGAVGQ